MDREVEKVTQLRGRKKIKEDAETKEREIGARDV
jgi:hypothetical protein